MDWKNGCDPIMWWCMLPEVLCLPYTRLFQLYGMVAEKYRMETNEKEMLKKNDCMLRAGVLCIV